MRPYKKGFRWKIIDENGKVYEKFRYRFTAREHLRKYKKIYKGKELRVVRNK